MCQRLEGTQLVTELMNITLKECVIFLGNHQLLKFLSLAASPDFFSGNLRTISYFDFKTLKRATKNFHPDNLLGRGGFGPVYKVSD